VSGFVYDVVTGLVERVIPTVADDGDITGPRFGVE
jgi:hypothetical protein